MPSYTIYIQSYIYTYLRVDISQDELRVIIYSNGYSNDRLRYHSSRKKSKLMVDGARGMKATQRTRPSSPRARRRCVMDARRSPMANIGVDRQWLGRADPACYRQALNHRHACPKQRQ